MSEQPQEYVRYEWQTADDPDDHRLHVVATFGDARIHIDFNDDAKQGTRALGRLVSTMPTILMSIRQELSIRAEVAGVDDELRDLLGEGEL